MPLRDMRASGGRGTGTDLHQGAPVGVRGASGAGVAARSAAGVSAGGGEVPRCLWSRLVGGGAAGGIRPAALTMARVYPHRRADSVYGRIRAALAARPAHAWATAEIVIQVPDVGRKALVEKLHKMARRRQILRVEVPGERFARWMA